MVNKWSKELVWLASLLVLKDLWWSFLEIYIETSNFKALLTYHFLILFNGPLVTLMMLSADVVMVQSRRMHTFTHNHVQHCLYNDPRS